MLTAEKLGGSKVSLETSQYYALTDAASGQTIYVNPAAIRFVVPAGHRTALIFSEQHVVTVTADIEAVIAYGLFGVANNS